MTTNGMMLSKRSQSLKDAGLGSISISVDSLKADRFKELTRLGDLDLWHKGIKAAKQSGFNKIKLNTVILAGFNDDEVLDLVEFARYKGIDIAFIEEMPLGIIESHDRAITYCSSDDVREIIEQRYPLIHHPQKTAGPSRYYSMANHNTRIGFISPHSHNFCGDCNRVRVTVEGRLLLCLGNEYSVDLMPILHGQPGQVEPLKQAIIASMALKPEKHHFDLNEKPQILRFMNATGR